METGWVWAARKRYWPPDPSIRVPWTGGTQPAVTNGYVAGTDVGEGPQSSVTAAGPPLWDVRLALLIRAAFSRIRKAFSVEELQALK